VGRREEVDIAVAFLVDFVKENKETCENIIFDKVNSL
jgi:hypothetical protein